MEWSGVWNTGWGSGRNQTGGTLIDGGRVAYTNLSKIK